MLPTALFDYELPSELIARYPSSRREDARMMVLDRQTGAAEPRRFVDILEYLSPGDALIYNDTKVLRGRMYGRKEPVEICGGKIELLLVAPAGADPAEWLVLLKPGKRVKPGSKVTLLDAAGELNRAGDSFTIVGTGSDGEYQVRFSTSDMEYLQRTYGHIPLPPYLNRPDENADAERYQTVYAASPGAVAAPTAGLHFSCEVLSEIRRRGVRTAALTLHVGPGTFKPVAVEDATQHQMHFEEFCLPEATAELINATHASGHRVLAVGTTTVRVLESCVDASGRVFPQQGRTGIFLYPPARPRAVDLLLTNFHLPKSTLLMLVSCFCDREKVLEAYKQAIALKFRFYSYGDCMLLK